jgi:hypothetical protein
LRLIAKLPPANVAWPAVSRWRWVMVGFAFFATVINYLDRQVLSVMVFFIGPLRPDARFQQPQTVQSALEL